MQIVVVLILAISVLSCSPSATVVKRTTSAEDCKGAAASTDPACRTNGGKNKNDSKPPKPGNNGVVTIPAASIKAGGVTVTWEPAIDDGTSPAEIKYLVYYSLQNNITTLEDALANGTKYGEFFVDVTEADIIGLDPSTTYYFTIIAEDASGNQSIYSVSQATTVPDVTAPTAGIFAATSLISETGFTLNWTAAVDDATLAPALNYLVCSGANAAAIDTVDECLAETIELDWTANILAHTITGKSALNTYYFNVLTKDATGNTSFYEGITVTTLDQTAPTSSSYSLTASGTSQTGLTVNWTKATDNTAAQSALQYEVRRSLTNNITTLVNAQTNGAIVCPFTADINSCVVSSLSVATTYYFNVIVKDSHGNKRSYTSGSFTTLPDTLAPNAGTYSASTVVTPVSFTLNWSAATDDYTLAPSLQYFVCSGPNSGSISSVTGCETATQEMNWTANTLQLAISGKSASTTYYYNTIVKDNAGNKSIYNGKQQATTADLLDPTAGSFTTSTSVTTSSFNLNWAAASDNATPTASLEYFVCSGANAAAIDSVSECESATQEMGWTINTTSLAISGKSLGTTYYFNTIVRDAGGNKSIYNGKAQATSSDSVVPTAGTFSASSAVGPTSFTLNWGAGSDNTTATASLEYYICSSATAAQIDTVTECEGATQELNWATNILTLNISGKSPSTTYFYNALVRDAAGNKSIYNGISQATSADTTAPTSGSFSSSTSVRATGFTLNWSAATDVVTPSASLQYFVCSSGSAAAINTVSGCEGATQEMNWTANTLSFNISSKQPLTTYYYNVLVKDAAENKAIYNGKSQATTADLSGPTIGSPTLTVPAPSITSTSLTIQWSKATDNVSSQTALEYLAYYSTTNNITSVSTAEANGTAFGTYTSDINQITVTGLNSTTSYYFIVVVRDEAGNKSAYTSTNASTAGDTTPPTAGTYSASTSVTETGFVLNWSAASDNVTGASALQYFVCSGATAAAVNSVSNCEAATQEMAYTANTLTLSLSGKSPATTYYYNVVVKDAANNKSLYDGKSQATLSDTTVPTSGTFSASTSVGATGFTLNWSAATDNVTGASSLQYMVCSGASAAAINSVANCESATQEMAYTANTLTFAITGKTPSTPYYYNVVVKDAANNKSLYDGKTQSTTADATVPTAGTFSASTSVGTSGFTLNWSAATDNVTAQSSLQYLVCSGASAAAVNSVANCEAATQEMPYTANTLTLVVSGKSPATTYYYNVVVKDGANNKSLYDGKTQATSGDSTVPTASTFSASTSVGATGFTLNWGAATDNSTAQSSLQYFVCSGANAAAVNSVANCEGATQEMAYTTNVLSLVITGKTPSTNYYYNVVVKDASDNKSLYDGKTQTTTADTTVPTAGSFSASSAVGSTGFTLNWSAATDNVTAQSSLEYFVCSGASAVAINSVANCEAATQEMAYTANTLTLAVSGKSPSTNYYYNVVVKDAANNKSLYDGKTQATTTDSTVPNAGSFSASSGVSATGFTLNWSSATDNVTATSALEYFVCSGASAAAINSVSNCEGATQEMAYTANTLTLAITGKSPSTNYYYNVVVRDAANNKSLYNGITQATVADSTAPTAGTFSASTGVGATGFTLNWSGASDNVTSGSSLQYLVCSGASAAAINSVANCEAATQEMAYTANTLTLAISGKSPSTTYYYNVVVRDAANNKSLYDGKTQLTSADTTVPTAGTFSASTSVGNTGFTLNWSASSDNVTTASSLQYFVCSGASAAAINSVANCEAATQEMAYTANTLTLAITGKSPSTNYYYNVVVKDAADNKSLYDGKTQATTGDSTVPTAGSFSASSGIGSTGFTLNWSAATDNVTTQSALEYFVCSGASASAINSVANCEAATQEMAYTANTLTLAISGKSPSTAYYYNVVVKDAANNKSLYNGKTETTSSDSTVPTAGTFSSTTGVGATGFTLNWSAATDNVTGASSLQYFVCSGASAAAINSVANCEAATQEMAYTANTLTLAVTGRSPSTTYYYNVVVKDAANNKSLYDGKTQATNADTAVPTIADATLTIPAPSITATGFTVTWNKATDNVTAQSGLEYLAYTSTTNNIGSVANAEANGTAFGSYATDIAQVILTGLTPSTNYFVNVIVRDAAGNKSLYTTVSGSTTGDSTAPTAATFSSSTSVTPTSFTLNWSAATDNVTTQSSLQYLVCSGASAAAVNSVSNCEAATQEMAYTANTLTLAISNKTPSTTYYYNVVVKDAANNKSLYDGKAQATLADTTAPTAGTFSASTSVGTTGFTLNWSAATDNVTNASSLEYFVCSGASAAAINSVSNCEGATQEMAYTANTLTLAISGKSPSTNYYYNVVVKDAANNKSLYNGITQSTTADSTVPTAGTFSSSTSITSTGFTLNWSAASDNVTAASSLEYFVCSGASAVAINSVANCEAATQEMAYTANTLTLVISGKSPSTAYYYNIVVKDAANNKSLYEGKAQSTTGDATAPTAGSFSSSTSVGATGFTLNWSAASDNVTAASSLEYFVCSGASAVAINSVANCEAATQEMAYTANTLTLAITGKSPSTTYYYNVVVKDAANNKTLYNGISQATTSDSTVPTAGSFSASSSVGATGFTLNWSAASDNVTAASSLEYFVCSGASAVAINSVANCEAATQEMAYTANILTLAITGKSPSTTYYYNVVVKDAANNKSLYSGISQATTSDSTVPTAGSFSASSSVGATGFTLNWSAATDNVTAQASLQYFVCSGASAAAINSVSNCEGATQEMAYTANTLTLAISGKSPSTTYYYNVVVKDAANNKSLYNGISQATTSDSTVPTAGSFSASSSVGATGFTLNWSAASDNVTAASSLEYFVCSGASAVAINSVANCEAATQEMAYTANTLTLAISGKSPSTTYYYNVVVKDAANNKSLYNGISQATTSDSTVPTAGSFSASSSVGATGFTLNWSAASDNVTAASSLEYFVCSGASAVAINSVANCEAATQEMTYTANTLTLAISGKSPSTTYYYNVVVKDAANNKSLYNGISQATTSDSTVPTAGSFSSSSSVGATGFTLNWSAASDNVTAASSLEYFVCSGASAVAINSVANCEAATQEMAYTANTLTLAISGKSPSTTYYYNVVVKDAANNKSLYNGISQATTSDSTVPTAGSFSASSSVGATGFTLNWSAASDNVTAASSLEYFVCSGASAVAINSVANCEAATQEMAYTANTLTLAISGKSPSTTYYYNVVVKDAANNKSLYNGISQATTSDSTVPTAGSFSASTSVGPTGFTLNWSAASDNVTAASSLEYFVCSGASAVAINSVANCEAATQEMAYTANTLTLAISGKSPSTTYYYNVVVKDAANNKSLYNGISQATTSDSTVPTAGSFSASSSVGATGFTLNWSAASDNVTAASSLEYFVCSGASAVAINSVANCEAATQEMAYTANTLTLAISGKSPSTTYYYNVVVKDAANNKSLYNGISQATTADITGPTVSNTTLTVSVPSITATGFTVTWNKATDNVTAQASLEYLAYTSTTNNIGTVSNAETNGTAFGSYATDISQVILTGFSPSSTYFVNVIVKDAAGNKSIYATVSGSTTGDSTPPTAGTFSSSTSVTTSSFTLNWGVATDNVTAAGSLQYFVCSGASAAAINSVSNCEGATQEMAYTANTLTLAISGKSPSTTYYYNVVVKDAANNKSLYNGISQATTADTTVPTAGSFSSSTSVGATGFTLNWSAATDNVTAQASLQYFVCSGASAVAINSVANCEAATQEMAYSANTLTLAISGKSPSTTYYYNVVVKDAANNKSLYNGISQATTSDSTVPTAGSFSASTSVGATGFTLNWSAATDNVTAQASLQYFVCSGASAVAINSVANCEAATQEMAYSANTLTLAISGKSPSTTYYYNVVVKDAANNKSLYNGISQATTADTTVPTAGSFSASTSVGPTGFTLNWSAASDNVTAASSLEYFVCSGASAVAINSVANCEAATQEMAYSANTLTLAISGKSPSTTYYYNVVVKDAANNKSLYNGISQATTSDSTVPTAGSFSASTSVGATGFTLNWSAATDNVTAQASLQYFVCSGASAVAINSVANCEAATQEMAYTANTLTLAISGKSPSTTYYYNVVVKDAANNKSLYNGISQATTADSTVPTAGAFSTTTSLAETSLTLNWTAGTDNVTAASSLEYFVCSGASAAAINTVTGCEGATQVMNWTANTLTRNVTGLTVNTTYYFNVIVRDAAANKSIYNGKSETTIDVTGPTPVISLTSGQATLASAYPVSFDVDFGEALTGGSFTASDVSEIGSASTVTWAVAHLAGNRTYRITATASTGTPPYTIIPRIAAAGVTDVAGNNNLVTSGEPTVTWGPASIVITTTPVSAAVGACSAATAITVQLRDSGGSAFAATGTLSFTVAGYTAGSTPGFNLYNNTGCTTATGITDAGSTYDVAVSAASSATVYIKANTTVGNPLLTINWTTSGSLSTTQGLNFGSATQLITKLVYTATPTGGLETCKAVTITSQNSSSSPVAVSADKTLNLTAAYGDFYTGSTCATTTTQATLANGQSSVTVYYSAKKSNADIHGTHAITADETPSYNWTTASGNAVVEPRFQTDATGGLNINPTLISSTSQESYWVDMAVGNDGTAMALYLTTDGDATDGSTTDLDIMACRYNGSSWETCTAIDPGVNTAPTNAFQMNAMTVHTDDNGNYVAAWRENITNSLMKTARYISGSGWESPVTHWGGTLLQTNGPLGRYIAIKDIDNFVLAGDVDQNNTATNDFRSRYKMFTAGSWGSETAVSDYNSDSLASANTAIGMQSNGNFYVVWNATTASGRFLRVRKYTWGTGWGASVALTPENTTTYTNVIIAITPAGKGAVMFRNNLYQNPGGTPRQAYYAITFDGTSWSGTVQQLSALVANDVNYGNSLAVDDSGNAVFVYPHDHDANTTDRETVSRYFNGGSYQSGQTLLDSAGNALLNTANPNTTDGMVRISAGTNTSTFKGAVQWIETTGPALKLRRLTGWSSGVPQFAAEESNPTGSNSGLAAKYHTFAMNKNGTLGFSIFTQAVTAIPYKVYVNKLE